MLNRLRTIGASAFALIAFGTSAAFLTQTLSSPVRERILIPSLGSGNPLYGQVSSSETPVAEFSPSDAEKGITLRKDTHNFFSCGRQSDRKEIHTDLLKDTRLWMYEFTGNEPPFAGRFFISPGELAANPQFTSLNTLNGVEEGERYYLMTERDLEFQCSKGIFLPTICGDGILNGEETCDGVEGCSDECRARTGFTCNKNICRLLIPTLPKGETSSASSSSVSSIVERTHTACMETQCVTVLGEGANGCASDADCARSGSISAASQSISSSPASPQFSFSIKNANPDANGTAVPTGIAGIGQFRFTAIPQTGVPRAEHRAIIDGIVFTVNATNVALSASSFSLYEKSNTGKKVFCSPHYLSGEEFGSDKISGIFLVRCSDLKAGIVNTEIKENAALLFVLEADIFNPNIASASGKSSALHVSIENITVPGKVFGTGKDSSHIRWYDRDQATNAVFDWIEFSKTSVKSTLYQS